MLLSLKLFCSNRAQYSRISFYQRIDNALAEIKAAGTFKSERIIQSPQTEAILVGRKKVTNFCANNYLGLCNDDSVKAAAHVAIDKYGAGLGSVRFICGTQVKTMIVFSALIFLFRIYTRSLRIRFQNSIILKTLYFIAAALMQMQGSLRHFLVTAI